MGASDGWRRHTSAVGPTSANRPSATTTACSWAGPAGSMSCSGSSNKVSADSASADRAPTPGAGLPTPGVELMVRRPAARGRRSGGGSLGSIEQLVEQDGNDRPGRQSVTQNDLCHGGKPAIKSGHEDRQQPDRQRDRQREQVARHVQIHAAQDVDPHAANDAEHDDGGAADYRRRDRVDQSRQRRQQASSTSSPPQVAVT